MADTLPIELVERILSFAASIDVSTALVVCLTNRLGRRAGQPVLYHTLELPGNGEDGDTDIIIARMRKWTLLCRTVLESRHLAKHVREIRAYLHDVERLTFEAPLFPYGALGNAFRAGLSPQGERGIWKWLSLQSQRAQVASRHVQLQRVENNDSADDDGMPTGQAMLSPEVYLSILTLACSEIRMIHMLGPCTFFLKPFNELGMALEIALPDRNPDGFSSIEKVHFHWNDGKMGTNWTVEQVGQALRWPSIKELSIDSLAFCIRSWPSLGSDFTSNLVSLHISDSVALMEELHLLLVPCPLLRSFSMSWSRGSDVYRDTEWRTMGNTLKHRNPLLEVLHLDIAAEEGLREICNNDIPRPWEDLTELEQIEVMEVNNEGLGSLCDLKYLRKVSVPYIALFGVFDDEELRDHDWTLAELLPDSVERLDIFGEELDFTERENTLLSTPGVTNLSELTIWNCTRNKSITSVRNEGDEGQPSLT